MEWLPPCCDMSRLGDRQASRRVDGSPLREEEQEEDGEYPHLSPCLSPFGNTFSFQLFYLCQLPCRTLRDIGAVEARVRGPAIHSSLCLSVLSAWHLWADDWSSTPRGRGGTLAPSQRDERKAAFKQDGPCPDRPEEPFKTFASHYKKKKSYGNIIISWHFRFVDSLGIKNKALE